MDAKLKYAVIAACLLCAPAGPSAETRPRHVKTGLVGSLLSKPTTIDPIKARSHAELTLTSLVFDTLYTVDLDGTPIPRLATELPQFVNGTTARISLYPGVLFHNGVPLTADDVVASLRRLADDPESGWLLESIDTIGRDGDDVVLELHRDTPELARLLGSPRAAITRKGEAPRLNRAQGTGPFRLLAMSKNKISLRRFDKHFYGPSFIRGLTLKWFETTDAEAKAYEAGDSHLSLRGAVAFAGHKPKYRTSDVEGPAVTLTYVGFGKNRKVLSKAEFRRAVSLAVSRDALRNIGSGEKIVPTIYPAADVLGGPATTKADRKADRVGAKRLIDKLTVGSGPIEVLIDRSRLDDRLVGEKLVAALLKIGLDAKLTEKDADEFARKTAAGQCDLYIGQLSAVAADPALQFAAAFAVARDSWAEKELRTAPLNPVSIVGAFKTRLPIVPLFHRAVRVHHRSNVRGAELDVLSRLSYADLRLHGPPRRSK